MNNIGRIELVNMEFFSNHGCFEEERIIGNKFIVNCWVDYDCSKAAESDDINDALKMNKEISEYQVEVAKML